MRLEERRSERASLAAREAQLQEEVVVLEEKITTIRRRTMLKWRQVYAIENDCETSSAEYVSSDEEESSLQEDAQATEPQSLQEDAQAQAQPGSAIDSI